MWFTDFLEKIFPSKDGKLDFTTEELNCIEKARELFYMQLGQHVVAERYGSLLSKCEVKTFINNEEVKKDNWYLLNIEPNPNQSGSEFMKQLASKLIFDFEALIIVTDEGYFYIADKFKKSDYQIKETYFTDVSINLYGDKSYDLSGVWRGKNAIYIKYANRKAKEWIESMNLLYADLISNVKSAGSNKLKYLLNIDMTAMQGIDVDIGEEIRRITNSDFRKLVSDNNAIMPIMNGFKLEPVGSNSNNAQNANMANSSVNSMYEDIMTNIGHVYNVPKSFMLGGFANDDMDQFLTFGLDPFTDLIEEAINRKFYGKKAYLSGAYCSFDTKRVKHFDILTVSGSINQLISSGVYTINELRTVLEEPLIDPEIGDKHWITRNYAVVGDYIQEQRDFNSKEQSGEKQSTTGGGLK